MRIMNIMLGQKLGGIEHVFVDYTHALELQGHEVISVVHPKAQVRKHLTGKIFGLFNWNALDVIAALRLRWAAQRNGIDLMITHGNRALALASMIRGRIPLLAVSHNYRYKRLHKASAIVAITKTMAADIHAKIPNASPVYPLYNPIILEEGAAVIPPCIFQDPPILGFLGRLVPKKGASVFLQAMAELKKRGVVVKANIAGEGPERESLEKLAEVLGLKDVVSFLGWVGNRDRFFESIDLFVIPSLEEPFGVVVLEGWKYGKPLLATLVGGPAELVEDGLTGLLVSPDDASALADGIERVLQNPEIVSKLVVAGRERVEDFGLGVFSKKLQAVVEAVVPVPNIAKVC